MCWKVAFSRSLPACEWEAPMTTIHTFLNWSIFHTGHLSCSKGSFLLLVVRLCVWGKPGKVWKKDVKYIPCAGSKPPSKLSLCYSPKYVAFFFSFLAAKSRIIFQTFDGIHIHIHIPPASATQCRSVLPHSSVNLPTVAPPCHMDVRNRWSKNWVGVLWIAMLFFRSTLAGKKKQPLISDATCKIMDLVLLNVFFLFFFFCGIWQILVLSLPKWNPWVEKLQCHP